MNFETIETERLILRKVGSQEYDFVLANYTDEQLLHFFGLDDLETLQKEKGKYSLGFGTFNKGFLFFHLIEKETQKNIAWCGYHTWYLDHQRAEIGYVISNNKNWGKGFMSEALKPIINYGFEQMNLHRMEAFIGLNNAATYKLLTKNGFVKEGLLREHYFTKGAYEDSLLYALLKKDYEK